MVEEVRAPFGYDADAVSLDTGLACEDESLTVQADKADADINTLVKRFGLTGELPQNVRAPIQADFVAAMTYQESLNAMREAEAAFMEMPADVRARFDHDPGRFVDFASNPDNLEDMRKMGLAPRVEAPIEPEEFRLSQATIDALNGEPKAK